MKCQMKRESVEKKEEQKKASEKSDSVVLNSVTNQSSYTD